MGSIQTAHTKPDRNHHAKNMQNHLAQPNRLTFAIDEETNEEFILNALLPIRISMPVSI